MESPSPGSLVPHMAGAELLTPYWVLFPTRLAQIPSLPLPSYWLCSFPDSSIEFLSTHPFPPFSLENIFTVVMHFIQKIIIGASVVSIRDPELLFLANLLWPLTRLISWDFYWWILPSLETREKSKYFIMAPLGFEFTIFSFNYYVICFMVTYLLI
jgi:hypothetical protein